MIIDTHFHAFPMKYLELLPEAKNDSRGTGLHAFDHHEYLNVMDKYGIDIGVLSNTAGRIEKLGSRQRAKELCQVANDDFADAHAKHPQRFRSFARLPMLDVDDCVRELERCYKELHMDGVIMPTNVAGKYIDSRNSRHFGTPWRSGVNRYFSIRPTRRAKPTGTSIPCTRKFSGRRTARWQSRASCMPAFSTAIRSSS
jgi:predicted TIM-barrel fold metal-dependent hydrolase